MDTPKNVVDAPKVTVPPATMPKPEQKVQFEPAKPAGTQPAPKAPVVPAR